MKFTKTSKRSGAATLLRQSENVLGIAQAVRSRSNRALGFVNKHRVHLLTKGLCRAANSCKLGLIVSASRVAFNGLCTTARLHIVEENRACVLGCPEGLVCGIVIVAAPCSTIFVLSGLAKANALHPQLFSTIYS